MSAPAVASSIAGCRREGRGAGLDNIDPASGALLGVVTAADDDDIEEAMAHALDVQSRWVEFPVEERAAILLHVAAIVRDRVDAIARIEVTESGRTIASVLDDDILTAADTFEYVAHLIGSQSDRSFVAESGRAFESRVPHGVCLGLGAWNYPFQIAAAKIAPALAAGNAMVFKPSPLTPSSALEIADALDAAGAPPGLLQVLQGGSETGRCLVRHAAVRHISLTGSVETGRDVFSAAATDIKRLTLELGGKSPLIILEDTPVETAVQAAMLANFIAQGQVCSAGSRVFVAEVLVDDFVDCLRDMTARLRVGSPLDPTTQIGPLVSQRHRARVQGFVDEATSAGAKIIVGGAPPQTSELDSGSFFLPTVLMNVSDDMRVVQDEVFGPVLSVLSFKTDAEVVQRANRTHFGLAAGVFSVDERRAKHIAGQLEAGVVWVNNYHVQPPSLAFGGMKLSGCGREGGEAGLLAYSDLKTIYVEGEGMADGYFT